MIGENKYNQWTKYLSEVWVSTELSRRQEQRTGEWLSATCQLGCHGITLGYFNNVLEILSLITVYLPFQFLRKYMTSQMTWPSMKEPMSRSLVWPPGSQSLPFPGGTSPHQVSAELQHCWLREWVKPFHFSPLSWDYDYRQHGSRQLKEWTAQAVSNKASWFLDKVVYILIFWVITNQ